MGFGLRKDIYTQKPRKPFINFKKILDIEVTHYHQIHENEVHKILEEEKEKIRLKIIRERRIEFIKISIVSIVIILFIYLLYNLL